MSYLFNLLYIALLILVSPWLLYAALRTGKYREGLLTRFLGCVAPSGEGRPCIWLHAVSVGEVNLLAPLIDALECAVPNCQCVVSTTTRTGYALANRKYSPRTVFYCPLDFSWSVRAAMRRVRPDLLVLAELELWPNLIRSARQNGVRVAMVNGRMSDSSYRGYRRIQLIVRQILSMIDVVAAQNVEYADRFRALGAPDHGLHVTGSMKFDGVQTDRQNKNTQRLAALAQINADDLVFVAGSTQAPEEQLALNAYLELSERCPRLRLIIVPRHPERFDAVAQMLDHSRVGWNRRSELSSSESVLDERVLLVDTVGELSAWWGTAHIAYVGGSMGSRGGQNMIEPAAYGALVCFGPCTTNFRDVVMMLLNAQGAVVVDDGAALTRLVQLAIEDPDLIHRRGRAAQQLVLAQSGATERTVRILEPLLNPVSPGVANRRGSSAAA